MGELHLGVLHPADRDKVPAILEAASMSHQRPRKTPDWFEWKFWGSPFGPAAVAYAETTGGQIAGVVAFGLYGLTHSEATIKAALSYETFVHPDFRRQGLFTKLMRLGMKECRDRGVQMMFNFPNAASVPGFRKQGWIPVDCIQSSVKPLRWMSCVRGFDRGVRAARFAPGRISGFDSRDYEGFDDCLATMRSIRSDSVWSAVRTPEYMVWRYRTYPMNRYIIIQVDTGWAIVRTGKRGNYTEVQIMELFPSSGYGTAFLRALCRGVARRLRPDIITLTLSRAHPVSRSLWMAGFLPVPFRGGFTYYPLAEALRNEERGWVLTATEFHTY